MSDHDLASDLSRLRRGAYEFMRGSAAQAWEHEDGGDRWDITLPPDLAALPERQRFRVHARQEARRVARAQLYDLDPRAVGLAVRLGESIGQVRRESAAPAASPGSVTAPWVIRPPAAAGFVRWRDAIGYNSMGAPVVACHWGPWGAPAAGGTWLAWWADSHAMTAAYEAAARADGQHASFGALTEAFGPLWYDHQELLRPGTAPGGSAVPEPQATAAALSPPEDGTSGLALLRTTLATWHLMTCPEAVQLSRRPLPAAEQAADRAAGLAVGPVTCATPTGKR